MSVGPPLFMASYAAMGVAGPVMALSGREGREVLGPLEETEVNEVWDPE